MMLYGLKMAEIRKAKDFTLFSLYGIVVPCFHSVGNFNDMDIPDFCER